jgi:hypothetical protein
MTGYFPAQHGVKWTLAQNMPASDYPQAELPLHLGEHIHASQNEAPEREPSSSGPVLAR